MVSLGHIRNLLLLTILCSLISEQARGQKLEWAKIYVPIGDSKGPSQLTISNDNKIGLAGYFTNNTFSPSTKGIFVYHTDSIGNLLWGDTIGFHLAETCNGLAFNSQNNLYLGGNLTDSMFVDGNWISGKSFICRYKSDGSKKWIKAFSEGEINDVTVDKNDNLFVLLTIHDTINFFNQTFIPHGPSDILILKINTADSLIFSKQLYGTARAFKIRVTNSGNIAVFGENSDTLYVGSSWYDWTHKDTPDQFVLKMDGTGSALSFSYACNDYFGKAEDFAIGPDEKFVVTGFSCHHGCTSTTSTFDQQGDQISPAPGHFGGIGYVQGGVKVAVGDPTGWWAFVQETHYEGNPWAPDSTWFLQCLLKLNFTNKVLYRDTFSYQSASRAIATDGSGAVYISSTIFAGATQNLQGVSLQNTNHTQPALYIAKFRDIGNYLAIPEHGSLPDISIFPNPTSGKLKIQAFPNSSIRISDVFGRPVYQAVSDKKETDIDLSNQSPGIYLVTISLDGWTVASRIVRD